MDGKINLRLVAYGKWKLSQLPAELQWEVLKFAESLVHRTAPASTNGMRSVHSMFGVWDSGDPHWADDDQIDADIAHELTNAHEAE